MHCAVCLTQLLDPRYPNLIILLRENNEWLPECFWPAHKTQFPRIQQFARHFGCILPSSAPSERVWSAMKQFLTETSSIMEADKAIQLLFLNQHPEEFEQFVRASAIDATDDDELNIRDEELHGT